MAEPGLVKGDGFGACDHDPSSSAGEKVNSNRVLFVCLSSGFFLRHHLRWAVAAANGAERHVAVNLDGLGDADELRRHGFTVHPLRERRGSVNPIRAVHEAMYLRRVIREVSPRLIITITLKTLFTTATALLGSDHPPLAGVITGLGHLFAGDSPKQRVLRNISMPTLAYALRGRNHVLIHSNADDRNELLRRGVGSPERSVIVPVPGVNMAEFRQVATPGGRFRVVLPARMLKEKGVAEFVAASRLLRQQCEDIDCILAGDVDPGNPSTIPREQLERWATEGAVSWLGEVTDMPAMLADCSVVCLPSHREGFPRVVAEAMAVGRAVVTTDVPGCRDGVLQSGGGLLVPSRDPGAIAEAILRLYRHRALRMELETRGHRWAMENLSEARIAERMKVALAMLEITNK